MSEKKYPEWANWLAVDSDGSEYAYEQKPTTHTCHYSWTSNGDRYVFMGLTKLNEGEWKDSLRALPLDDALLKTTLESLAGLPNFEAIFKECSIEPKPINPVISNRKVDGEMELNWITLAGGKSVELDIPYAIEQDNKKTIEMLENRVKELDTLLTIEHRKIKKLKTNAEYQADYICFLKGRLHELGVG